MANTPANKGTSVPSSSSERCATIHRTSACAVVSRTVPEAGVVVGSSVRVIWDSEASGWSWGWICGRSGAGDQAQPVETAVGRRDGTAWVERLVGPRVPYPRVGRVIAERYRAVGSRSGQNV